MKSNKKQMTELKRQIAAKKRELAKLEKAQDGAAKKWLTFFAKHMQAAEDLAKIKLRGTAKEARLRATILGNSGKSPKMTAEKKTRGAAIKKLQAELQELGIQLALVSDQEINKVNVDNDIVRQVLECNDAVVSATKNRMECLNSYVFPRLIVDGKLNTQVSFMSADGLWRIRAMVNRMTLIQGDMAQEAKQEIAKFFDRFRTTNMDDATQALYKLTEQLLTEKTTFKVGYDFYRFLSMKIDSRVFPELYRAQELLRGSMRSEKTNKYIRITKRKNRESNWEVVPQSWQG